MGKHMRSPAHLERVSTKIKRQKDMKKATPKQENNKDTTILMLHPLFIFLYAPFPFPPPPPLLRILFFHTFKRDVRVPSSRGA
jgi:hypothetical protein